MMFQTARDIEKGSEVHVLPAVRINKSGLKSPRA